MGNHRNSRTDNRLNRLHDDFHELNIDDFSIKISSLDKKNILPDSLSAPLLCLWEITRICNLNCNYCYNNSGRKLTSELKEDEKINLAKQIAEQKIFKVCLSGGEPLLDKSIWSIVKILKTGDIDVSTITNGYLLTNEIAKKMAKYFTKVQVSIDGARLKSHDFVRGINGSWEKAINACNFVVKNNMLLWISFVPTTHNIDDIGDVIDLSYNLGAERFRTERTRLTGRAAINRDIIPSEAQYKQLEVIIKQKISKYKNKMHIEYGGDVLAKYNASFKRRYPLPTFFLYISPSGTCSCNNSIPFLSYSIREKTLREIWDYIKQYHNTTEFRKILSTLKTNRDYLDLKEIPYSKSELHDK